MAKTGGEADERLARAWPTSARRWSSGWPTTVGLAAVAGHRLRLPRPLAAALPHRPGPVRARACSRTWSRAARRHPRIDLMVPATLVEVLHRATGRSSASSWSRPQRSRGDPAPRALLLATNGFGADAELVARHIPAIAGAVYHGSEGSRGDALRLGAALGARDRPTSTPTRATPPWPMPAATLAGWATVMHGGVPRRPPRAAASATRRPATRSTPARSLRHAGRRGVDRPGRADPRGLPAVPGLPSTPSSRAPCAGATT